MQVLADAAAIDAKAAAGGTITPLCGLPLAVKDTIDVEGYPTTAATPGLASMSTLHKFLFAATRHCTSHYPFSTPPVSFMQSQSALGRCAVDPGFEF